MGGVRLSAPPALPTIATQALPTGWRDGVRQRRIGAAGMLARAAHPQLEAVLERPVRLSEWCTRGALASAHLPVCSQHAPARIQVSAFAAKRPGLNVVLAHCAIFRRASSP